MKRLKKPVFYANSTKTIWVTRRGEPYEISQMGDEHLRNTIDMLRNRVNHMKEYVITFNKLAGDGKEAIRIAKMKDDTFLAEYVEPFAAMLKEARERGFTRTITKEVPF